MSKAYAALFELHGAAAWDLDSNKLITFFRNQDETTAVVGKLQATTFRVLAAYSGHGDVPASKAAGAKAVKSTDKPSAKKSTTIGLSSASTDGLADTGNRRGPNAVGLTVRIEVNLPADGEQATYDRIFKSIRENLLNG